MSVTDVAVVFNLDVEESLSIPFEFTPQSTGKYSAVLPIYIRGYNNGAVYNNMELKGIYPNATLRCIEEIIFEPIPVGETIRRKLEIKAYYHLEDCALNISCDYEEVVVDYPKGNGIKSAELIDELIADISFNSSSPLSFHTILRVTCECGGYREIRLMACADACSITTHMYTFLTNDLFVPCFEEYPVYASSTIQPKRQPSFYRFPYFVLKSDKSRYGQYMQNVCDAVERWIFKQVMFGKYYISIPNQMNDVFVSLKQSDDDSGNKKKMYVKKRGEEEEKEVLVIVKIFMFLLGDDIKALLVSRFVNFMNIIM